MSKMISVASGFQYSVNIGYDLNNDDKLKNFIPTRFALELLEDILLSTRNNSTDRARVLIGAYGKGKSHIVLTIIVWSLFLGRTRKPCCLSSMRKKFLIGSPLHTRKRKRLSVTLLKQKSIIFLNRCIMDIEGFLSISGTRSLC